MYVIFWGSVKDNKTLFWIKLQSPWPAAWKWSLIILPSGFWFYSCPCWCAVLQPARCPPTVNKIVWITRTLCSPTAPVTGMEIRNSSHSLHQAIHTISCTRKCSPKTKPRNCLDQLDASMTKSRYSLSSNETRKTSPLWTFNKTHC